MSKSLSEGKVPTQQQDMELYLNEATQTVTKADRLFKKYPTLSFRSKVIDGTVRLTEICPNEKYLNELGYSIDSFTSVVLREGLPK